MDRRELLQVLSSGLLIPYALSGHTQCGAEGESNSSPLPYRFQFFSAQEVSMLQTAMELLIPQDDHSPGATDARVIEFADLMIATDSEIVREDWRTGVRLLAAELQNKSMNEWIRNAAENEHNPQTVLDIFFRSLKQMTINGYYSSAIGILRELQYQGNTYVAVFKGCEHSEHRRD